MNNQERKESLRKNAIKHALNLRSMMAADLTRVHSVLERLEDGETDMLLMVQELTDISGDYPRLINILSMLESIRAIETVELTTD